MARNPKLRSDTVRDIASAWLQVQRNWWAYGRVVETCSENPRAGLQLIREMLRRARSKQDLGDIGAGPLEDLLENQREAVIDEIERLAPRSPRLRFALRGVWLNRKSPAIDDRLRKLGPKFDPKDNLGLPPVRVKFKRRFVPARSRR